jgi:hypothetical protein
MTLKPCPLCGAEVPGGDCTTLFHELLAREYMDIVYSAVHLLTVDCHTLQHPEDHGVKNNAFHLTRLCWILEHGGNPRIGQGPRWLQEHFNTAQTPAELDPPAKRGAITVAYVHAAENAQQHQARVREWAASVWEAWSVHHEWARAFLQEIKDRANGL